MIKSISNSMIVKYGTIEVGKESIIMVTYLIDQLRIDRIRLIDYLKMKVEQEDFHAVADAAMDLRELDAKIEVLRQK